MPGAGVEEGVLREGDFRFNLEIERGVGEFETTIEVAGAQPGDGFDADGDVVGLRGERAREDEGEKKGGYSGLAHGRSDGGMKWGILWLAFALSLAKADLIARKERAGFGAGRMIGIIAVTDG